MKQIKYGMIAALALFQFNAAIAAPGAAPGAAPKPMREALVDYTKQVKTAAFGAQSAKGLSAQKMQAAQDKIINGLELPAAKANNLTLALKLDATKTATRLDSLATIVAAKKLSVEIGKTDREAGESLSQAAEATATLLSNSFLTGARKTSTLLNKTELDMTTAALTKMENITEILLTRFNAAEKASYVKILNRHNELLNSGKKSSSEEAFVESIMAEKGVTKEKALEVVKKLKDCV